MIYKHKKGVTAYSISSNAGYNLQQFSNYLIINAFTYGGGICDTHCNSRIKFAVYSTAVCRQKVIHYSNCSVSMREDKNKFNMV